MVMTSIVLSTFTISLLIACSSLHKGVYGVSQCTTINTEDVLEKMSHLTSIPTPNEMILLPFYKVTCEGRVAEWEVQVNGRGTLSQDITFTVWKPNPDSTSRYSLVGKNSLTLTDAHNIITYYLTPDFEDQIEVQPGFVIGVHMGDPEGNNSAAINAASVDSSEPFLTHYFRSINLNKADAVLDTFTATRTYNNQIPLVSAKIVDKSIISTATPSTQFTQQTSPVPIPSSSSIDSSILPTIVSTASIASLETTSSIKNLPDSSITAIPTTDTTDDSLVFIGPVIAISILVLVIIVSTFIFVIMMCYTIRRRRGEGKVAVNNPTYDGKRKSINNEYGGFQFSRNPSYSPTTMDYHKLRKKVLSEHVYESCDGPYEYLEPVSLAGNKSSRSLPVHPNRLTKVSAIYEIPFALSEGRPNTSSCSKYCGINNLYLAASTLVQPAPVSPGYDVPVCPNVPADKGKESLEESALYKEPGWVYHS